MELFDKDGRSVQKDQLWFYFTDIVHMNRYPFSYWHLQWMLRNRAKNGLDKIMRKTGKRIMLRLDLFDEWLENHQPLRELESGTPEASEESRSEQTE